MNDLRDLEAIVRERMAASEDQSYTAKLLGKGIDHAAKKLGEEGVELALAAVNGSDEAVCAEAADLLYHLCVVLAGRGVAVDKVYAELERRTGQSGLAEKAARGSK